MRKFALSAITGAIGLALIAASARTVVAAEEGAYPPDGIGCYYHGFFCSYPGDDYWSNCNPNYGEGMISTGAAKVICATYNRH